MSLVHTVTGENSRIRRGSLYLFARYLEMPLLAWGYHLLRGRYWRLGSNRWVRALLSWGVAVPFGYAGDTARPMPTPQVLQLIDDLEGPIAVGPCRCRAAHQACDHPLETDLVIRTGVAAWTRAFPDEYRLISKEEAKGIVSSCRDLGLWQMVFVHCPVHAHGHEGGASRASAQRELADNPAGSGSVHDSGSRVDLQDHASYENEYVICNCCACGCVPYLLNRDLGPRAYPLLRGAYVAQTDLSRCTGRGDCVAACPFGVRALAGGRPHLVAPCLGCGRCVDTCPEGAIQMCQA
jgi:ferredoxin